MMSLKSTLKVLFLHICLHVVVVAKLRTNDKTQRSLIAFSPALDVTIADISVKYNNVKGYNVNGCLDPNRATQSKYSVQVQYEIRNNGDAGFIAPSRFVDYAACGTPAILNFLSLTIEGGRDSSGNLYPTIELSSFATCVIDDSNTADAAACVPTTDFDVKPSQSYGISQGGSYGVSKTVRVKFPLSTELFNALSNSAPATLTFRLSVNTAISPNGAAGVVTAVDGSTLKETTWQATGQGTSVLLFTRPRSAATAPIALSSTALTALSTTTPTETPTTASTDAPSTTPTALSTTTPTETPTTDAPSTTPTALPTTVPTTAPAAAPSTIPTALPTTTPTRVPTTAPASTTPTTAIPSTAPIACDNIIGPALGSTSIGASRYKNDRTLGRVCLTTNVQSIGDSAFWNDGIATISSIYIPSSVKTVEPWAFYDNKLTSVTFAGDIVSIGLRAFVGLRWYVQTPPISLVFPGTVGSIGEYAFFYGRVASLSFGGTVGYIGNNAFRDNAIKTVIFPAGLSFIGDDAFVTNALTSVTFRGAVATIGNNVFAINPALKTVYYPQSWAIPTTKFPAGVTFVPTN